MEFSHCLKLQGPSGSRICLVSERIFTSEPEACLLHAEECGKKMPEFVEMVLEMENVKLE